MATAVIAAPPQPRARKFFKLLRDGDQVAHLVTFIFAASVFLVTVLLVYELWIHSGPSRDKFGLSFLWKQTWDPVAGQFGAWSCIYWTVLT
jgi:phosphate transport system permease protein